MRPACHDGAVVARGQLYWGPWMCGCNLFLFGLVAWGLAIDRRGQVRVTLPDGRVVCFGTGR